MAKDKAGMTPAPRKTATKKPATTAKKVASKAAPAKKVSAKKPASRPSKPPTADERIAKYGEDNVIEALADGKTMTAIAQEIGVSIGVLSAWLSIGDERSARAREARSYAARIWDERAEDAIAEAKEPFELARAKELAHHYRWRASKIAPREYGDKVQAELTGAGGGAIAVQSTVTFVQPPKRSEDD